MREPGRLWLLSLGLVIVAGICLSGQAAAYELTPDMGAVIFEQLSFRDAPDSGVGEITIDLSKARNTGLSEGFINVSNSTGQWIVQNLPVMSTAIYDHPTITTRVALGVSDGTPVSFFDVYVDYSPVPVASFSGGPGGITRAFNVTPGFFAAGGVGGTLSGYMAGPDLAGFTFNPGGETYFIYQPGHQNVQAAMNQCAPAAVANSLTWLKDKKGLKVPHKNIPGLRPDVSPGDESLVGQLEQAMDRKVTSRTEGKGVWPYDGKVKYLKENKLWDKLRVKQWTGTDINWELIKKEIEHGEDVELDLHYKDDGRHYVEVTGFGMILGVPFFTHVSDHLQTDEDPGDKLGTDKVDFEWLIGNRALNSNAEIDEVITESVPEPLAMLLMGLSIMAFLPFRRLPGKWK